MKFLRIVGIILLVLIIAIVFFYFRYSPNRNPNWGLTFSYQEAQGLGFDWKVMYLDILSDLKPKNLRLMTYWEDIEKKQGQYDFRLQIKCFRKLKSRTYNVVLVVGRKQPRWPECHQPDWYNDLSADDQKQALYNFVSKSIDHFKTYTAIKTWQVENEPYFGFGPDCPKADANVLKEEINIVSKLDNRPIMVTDSGDRGTWLKAGRSGADDFGFTLYRVSYDEKYGGYYKYPLPAGFYRVRAGILKTFTKTSTVSDMELQMEPWFTNGALNTPIDQQKALMNPKVFDANILYAKKTGVSAHYLWGVEWWYWMAKQNGDWGMWEKAKELFAALSTQG
jgi:hypothetical protein